MKKLTEIIKTNKIILIIIAVIFLLIATVLFMNNFSSASQTSVVSSSNYQTDEEKKLCGILSSINGVGQTQVMINESDEGITGVVIVCDGGNNIMTRNDILNAVSTALNIDKKIIAIYATN